MVYKLTTHVRRSSSTVWYLTSMTNVLEYLRTIKYDFADVSIIDNTGIRCAFVRWKTIIKIEKRVYNEKKC